MSQSGRTRLPSSVKSFNEVIRDFLNGVPSTFTGDYLCVKQYADSSLELIVQGKSVLLYDADDGITYMLDAPINAAVRYALLQAHDKKILKMHVSDFNDIRNKKITLQRFIDDADTT